MFRETRLGLFAVFDLRTDKIYVGFPAAVGSAPGVPYEVQKWLFDTVGTDIEWGIVDGQRIGVFLTGQDAIAFKLRFGI